MTADSRDASFAFAEAEARSRTRAYQRAQRHSRRVRFLKRAIPLGAVGALVLIVAVSLLNPFANVEGLSLGPVSVSGTRVVMERPRLTGFQKDSRPYEVTAEEAAQDVRKPTLVELKTIRGRIAMDDAGTAANLAATEGLFDTQKELLRLDAGVRVTTTSGYSADLRSAEIDFKAGTVVSREPVRVGVGTGVIEAERMRVSENGRIILFEGRVRSTFTPAGSEASPGTAAAVAPSR